MGLGWHVEQMDNRVVVQRTPDVHQWLEGFDHIPEQACQDQPALRSRTAKLSPICTSEHRLVPTGIGEVQDLKCSLHRDGALCQFTKSWMGKFWEFYVAELRSDLRVRDQDTDRLRTPPQVTVSKIEKQRIRAPESKAQGLGSTSLWKYLECTSQNVLDREPLPNATQDNNNKNQADYHPAEHQERLHSVATVLARFAYPARRHPKTIHARVARGAGIADSALVQPICS